MLSLNQIITYIPESMRSIVLTIGGVVFAIFTLFSAFKFVPQGQLAMRKRFGKIIKRRDGTVKALRPGRAIILIPYIDTLEYVSSLDRTVEIRDKTISYNGRLFRVEGAADFSIEDIYRVRYVVDDFDRRIRAAAETAFRKTFVALWVKSGNFIEVLDEKELLDTFEGIVIADADRLGVKLVSIRVTESAEVGESMIATAINKNPNATPA